MVLLSSFNTAKSSHRFQTPKGKGCHPTTWGGLAGVCDLLKDAVSSATASDTPTTAGQGEACSLQSKHCYRTATENENKYIKTKP